MAAAKVNKHQRKQVSPTQRKVDGPTKQKLNQANEDLNGARNNLGDFTYSVELERANLLQRMDTAAQNRQNAVREAAKALGIDLNGPEEWLYDFAAGVFTKKSNALPK